MNRRRLLATGAAGVVLAGLSPARSVAATGAVDITVVTTIAQIADMVRAIAGDRVKVEHLLGEGIDPHGYKLTRSDTARLLGADAVLYNGLLLEGKMTDVLERIGASGKPCIAVAERIGDDRLIRPDGFEGAVDPHVWMDVALWARVAPVVRDALAALDPEGAASFAANAAALSADLARLDDYARTVLSSVPDHARVLVTAHDAFAYLGRAYGVEVVGIQGISTESEAGLRRIEEIVALLVDRRVPAVFVETSVSDRNVLALVEGAAARGHRVAVGGSLYSDAMGAPGTYEGTYAGMIDHNVTTIARALGGTAPARGLAGRLASAG